jgi:hypothetical protein
MAKSTVTRRAALGSAIARRWCVHDVDYRRADRPVLHLQSTGDAAVVVGPAAVRAWGWRCRRSSPPMNTISA